MHKNSDSVNRKFSTSKAELNEITSDSLAALRAAAQRFRRENKPLWQVATLSQLVEKQPDDPSAFHELGFALLSLDRHDAALAAFARACALDHDDPRSWEALAALERTHGSRHKARSAYTELLARWPEDPVALNDLWFMACEELDWTQSEKLESRLLCALQQQPLRAARVSRYSLIGAPESWPIETFKRIPTHPVTSTSVPTAPAPRKPGRLRIGYQSAHFHEHATGILVIGLIEGHSRDRVETHAFSVGPKRNDAYRRRFEAAFEHWHDCYRSTDTEIVEAMRAAHIDVLIDLDADNVGGRAGVAAQRPARVQAHYLGHPGTTSVDGLDFFIGDQETLPLGAESEFRESLLRLPSSYQPNDPRRTRPASVSREQVGLPHEGVAMCNFNQPWKWRREVFCIWLDALKQSPGATLTLTDPGEAARTRLLSHANEAGLHNASSRLRFAEWLPVNAHLARLGAFDLALDQWPYGAHTTTADAALLGVPTITRYGTRFAGRVATSLLRDRGLEKFVLKDSVAYGKAIVNLCCAQSHYLQSTKAALLQETPAGARPSIARAFEDLLEPLVHTSQT